MNRTRACTIVAILAIGASTGCASASVVTNPSTTTAHVIQAKIFNAQMMKCTADDPTKPVCTILEEQD